MDQRVASLINEMGRLRHWLSTFRTTDPQLIDFLRREADGGFLAADPDVFITAIDPPFANRVPVSDAAEAALRRTLDYLDSLRGAVLIEASVIQTAPVSALAPFAGTYFDVGVELGAVLDGLPAVASDEADAPSDDESRRIFVRFRDDMISQADVRIYVYDRTIGDGVLPTLDAVASHFVTTRTEVLDAIKREPIGKTILLDPRTGEIWMAGPFSATPTEYVVTAGTRRWWANCAWDMLGVGALVDDTVGIRARCTDCGEDVALTLRPGDEHVADMVVHFLLPAAEWYADIGFT